MTGEEIAERVLTIVADVFEVPREALGPDTRFFEDLDASLDVVEVFAVCEDEFGICIPEEGTDLATIGGLVAWIDCAINGDAAAWPPPPRRS